MVAWVVFKICLCAFAGAAGRASEGSLPRGGPCGMAGNVGGVCIAVCMVGCWFGVSAGGVAVCVRPFSGTGGRGGKGGSAGFWTSVLIVSVGTLATGSGGAGTVTGT